MKPAFAIVVNGRDITRAVETGLVSITTTDEAGMNADAVSVEIADPEREIALPAKGAVMDVYLGWRHTGATHVGAYKVDKVGRAGRPARITISGKGADITASSRLKQQKTRSFEDITIGALVASIADEHGLQAAVGQDFRDVRIAHLDQMDESDLHLLTRLAADHGAVFKPAAGHLAFTRKGEGKTVSGKALPSVTIAEADCSDWSVEMAERTDYQSVVAYWQDTAAGVRKQVREGVGEPAFTLRRPYADAAAARAAAKAKKEDLARGTGTAQVNLAVGNPAIFAETPLTLIGFDHSLDGRWMAVRVSHTLSGSGFTTSVEAEPPTS